MCYCAKVNRLFRVSEDNKNYWDRKIVDCVKMKIRLNKNCQ